jgi:hypothetical protein
MAPADDREAAADLWRVVLRRYLIVAAAGNLAWETAQLPLYTIWREGTARALTIAVLHCTAGDLLIATAALLLSLALLGKGWPDNQTAFRRVAMAAIMAGIGYTIFSEWLNIVVRQSWSYSELMPVIPGLGTGLSPIAQWLVVPSTAFWWAQRRKVGATCKKRDQSSSQHSSPSQASRPSLTRK